MNPPRLLVDWLAWRALPWWRRLWLRATGRGFWRDPAAACIACGLEGSYGREIGTNLMCVPCTGRMNDVEDWLFQQ